MRRRRSESCRSVKVDDARALNEREDHGLNWMVAGQVRSVDSVATQQAPNQPDAVTRPPDRLARPRISGLASEGVGRDRTSFMGPPAVRAGGWPSVAALLVICGVAPTGWRRWLAGAGPRR